jgi:aminocarboxymuconate-semialdehyde decarboxylase
MDAQGIDYQAINVNAWAYTADRALARDLIKVQNEKISQWCAKYPDRFVGMATLALQHPDLAADQLDEAVRKLGMRGAAIGGSVEGQELSDRKFDPFWAKAEELGVVIFMHPQPGSTGTTQNPRLQGRGGLSNTIGNPLETTVFLSHLIFEGTLDRFPGLKICAAHAGGYLPSYSGRSDALCGRGGSNGADCKALKKKPSEYFRSQLYIDTMIFHEEGLRHLVAEVGVDHLFYGTDYPFDWPVGIDFVLNAPFLSNADKEAILGGNLIKLLRITCVRRKAPCLRPAKISYNRRGRHARHHRQHQISGLGRAREHDAARRAPHSYTGRSPEPRRRRSQASHPAAGRHRDQPRPEGGRFREGRRLDRWEGDRQYRA